MNYSRLSYIAINGKAVPLKDQYLKMLAGVVYFILPVRTFPACCIPVRATYILRISLVP